MLKKALSAIRPKTLPASVGPVLVGSALASHFDAFRWTIFLLAAGCALLLQISVNLANDYFDAKSGVDTEERVGPVRLTASGQVTESQMKWALAATSALSIVIGCILISLSHWILLVFGVLSVVAVFAYSAGPYPLASNGLGEVAAFLFFGWLAVVGTFFAHSLSTEIMAFGFATSVGLFSSAIMLVNNIRDIQTDSSAGKLSLAVRLGSARSRSLYRYLIVAALLVHIVISFGGGLWSLLPILIIAPMARSLCSKILTYEGAQLNSVLAGTAKLELVYCVCVAVYLITI